jgi:hypothetical protein
MIRCHFPLIIVNPQLIYNIFYWLDWEAGSGKTFLVNGVNFMEYISQQKEDHVNQLEAERIAREQVRNSA